MVLMCYNSCWEPLLILELKSHEPAAKAAVLPQATEGFTILDG